MNYSWTTADTTLIKNLSVTVTKSFRNALTVTDSALINVVISSTAIIASPSVEVTVTPWIYYTRSVTETTFISDFEKWMINWSTISGTISFASMTIAVT